MSREVATQSPPLSSELMSASVYKRSQGRIVRQATCVAIWVIVALGCWRLYQTLLGRFPENRWLEIAIPGGILIVGAWVGFRLIHWPRFADFLISVEAEMNKVSWPAKSELVRASIVVMFTIFFLAMVLFLFDIVWQYIFGLVGVTS